MTRAIIHEGDALAVLSRLDTASCDAMVTDPPAGIGFMGREWDKDKGGRREWVAWLAGVMAEARRVLAPGAHALVWALPRTSHWTATAMEDAGYEVRDVITHHFGTGFPKSKAALKPATEHWILCRAPGAKGALNVDECRIDGSVPSVPQPAGGSGQVYGFRNGVGRSGEMSRPHAAGRWPANLVLSHAPDCNGACVEGCAVREMGEQSGVTMSPTVDRRMSNGTDFGRINDDGWRPDGHIRVGYADTGTAARFFYCAKPSRRERDAGLDGERNTHETVKPIELMRYLCRLVTPAGGTVLDPFAGSGTTGCAAALEGFNFVGVEQQREHVERAARRIRHWGGGLLTDVEVAV
jgi:hypothetical protein